jgi:hypothetical protein
MGNQLHFRDLLFHYSRITHHCPDPIFRRRIPLAKAVTVGYNRAYQKVFAFKEAVFREE